MNAPVNIREIEIISAEIKDILGEEFDAATFFDTLDGETNIGDLIETLILSKADAEANQIGAKKVADDFTARVNRMAHRQKSISTVLGRILDAMGEKKIVHQLATISRTKPRESVVVFDEKEVPTQLCKTVVTPDKAAIKKQLEAGEAVPGARLEKGAAGLTIRIK